MALLVVGFAAPAHAAVSSITPNIGSTAGGTVVTITGSGFGATQGAGGRVQLIGTTCALSSWSDTSITCASAAHIAGTGNVTVRDSGFTTQTLTNGYTYTATAAPTVTGISPTSGPLAAGTAVTITGTGFSASVSGVTIGGTAATSVVRVSATSITAVAPAGTAGAKNVVVTNSDTQTGTLTNGFTYVAAPTVTAISPTGGPLAGGTAVTITGTGFSASVSGVTIGGTAATSVVRVSATSITAVTPSGTAGAKDVVVTNSDTQTGTLTNGYTYAAAPTVTSISPTGGPLAAGTAVTITGTGFSASVSGVTIGGTAATSVVRVSATSITAVAPAGTAGAKNVVVTNSDAQTGTLTNGFTYAAAPTVTAISPTSGPLAGGTAVTITGTGFSASVSGVTIGGTAATSVVRVSATSITAVTPAGTAGAKNVVVTNSDTQTGTLTNGYTYAAAPTVTSISPTGGPLAGGTAVTITGTGFSASVSGVTIGGTAATSVVRVSATSITAVTPAGAAGAVDVVVTNSDAQTGTLTNGYTYAAAPTVTAISPNSGPLAAGTAVTITGTGFSASITGVTIGGVAATSVVRVSATSITAVAPAGTAGAKNVVVTNSDTQTGTLTNGYTYVAAPTVTAISPTGGALAGGTAVTITGTGFSASVSGVTIGGVAATSVVRVSATSITAVTPAGTAGAKNVVVTNSDAQTGTLTNGYTYVAAPTVTSISPTGGALVGGTAVTITGTGFSASVSGVTIGGVAATSVVRVSSTSITAVTPAGTAGAKDVVVTNSDTQNGTLTNGYTYVAGPTVTAISPTGGPLAAGTAVTITGTGFSASITGVTIGGVAATSVVRVSATSITAVAPAGTAGAKNVVVTNSDTQTGTLTNGYTYVAAPTVTSVSPLVGSTAGGTAITLTGTGFSASITGVTIGGVAATSVVRVSATSITAVTPAGTSGLKNVVVTNSDAQTGTLTNGFTYIGVSPASGPATGGTSVTITGAGFGTYLAGTSRVQLGAITCVTTALNWSATSITCTTAARAAGLVDLAVRDRNSVTQTLTGGFTYVTMYTVTYNGNTGSTGTAPTDPSSPYVVGQTATVVAGIGTLAKAGYAFAGWNTVQLGTGTSYAAGDTFLMPASNVTLYAQWTGNQYALAYNANGGTGTPPGSTDHATGSAVPTSDGSWATRTGYVLTGWNTAADGTGTAVALSGTLTMPASATTLYAQWLMPLTCTSTLYQVSIGNLYRLNSLTNTLSRVGAGNASQINAIGLNPADSFIYGVDASSNLYRIDANGVFQNLGAVTGIGGTYNVYAGDFIGNDRLLVADPASMTFYVINTTTRVATAVTMTGSWGGYDFAVNAARTMAYALQGTTLYRINLSTHAISATTVAGTGTGRYAAAWTDSSGAAIFADDSSPYSVWRISGLAGTPVVASLGTVTAPGLYNDGASCPSATSPYAPSATTVAASSVTNTTATVNGTVNASAVSTAATFEYSLSPTLASSVTTVTAAQSPVTGSTDTSVSYGLTGLSAGTTYYFRVLSSSNGGSATGSILSFTTPYAVTYAAGGGTGTVPVDSAGYASGDTVTVLGNTGPLTNGDLVFGGWNDGSTTYQPAGTFTMPSTNVTLTAVWTTVYTVTYAANGGLGDVPVDATKYAAAASATVLGNVGTPTVLSKVGFVFGGWTYDSTTYQAGNTLTMPASNVTLTAVWNQLFTVTFHNGNPSATGSMSPQTSSVAADLAANGFSLADWTFAGWAASAGGAVAYANEASYAFTESADLYAVWTQDTYTVTYAANGGSGDVPVDSTLYPVGGTVTVLGNVGTPTPLTKLGQTFGGWSYSGFTHQGGGEVTMPASNVTFTAVWEGSGPAAPTATTSSAGSVTTTSATLLGSVNPNFLDTTAGFCWGDDPALLGCTTVTADQSPLAAGGTAVPVSYPVAGLTSGTTYYFMVLASNTSGDATGSIMSFVAGVITPEGPPAPPPPPKCTISFFNNGGNGSAPAITVICGEWANAAQGADFSREGYDFAGWNTQADGSGASFAGGAPLNITGDNALYAVWTPKKVETTGTGTGTGPGTSPAEEIKPVATVTPAETPVTVDPLKDNPPPTGQTWNVADCRLVDPVSGDRVESMTTEQGTWTVDVTTCAITFAPAAGFSGDAQVGYRMVSSANEAYSSLITVKVLEAGTVPAKMRKASATVYFAPLSSELSKQARKALRKLVRQARAGATDDHAEVVGFVQPVGGLTNDMSLSQARAKAVKEYLAQLGIKRITTVEGLGRASEPNWKARRATATIWYAPHK